MCLSENELVSRIFKELLCINERNIKILKKKAKILKEVTQFHKRRCATSLTPGKRRFKLQWKPLHNWEVLKLKRLSMSNVGYNMEQLERLYIVSGNVKWYSPISKQFGNF